MNYAVAVEKKNQAIYGAFTKAMKDYGVGTMPERDILRVIDIARHSLAYECEQLFWTQNTAQLVFASSKSLQLDTLSMSHELLTIPNAFCWFDQAVESVPFADGHETPLVAISWHTVDATGPDGEHFDALLVVAYGQSKFYKDRFYAAQIDQSIFGHVLRESDVGGTESPIKFVIAANAFIRQRLLINEKKRVDEKDAKRLRKRGITSFRNTVNVVQLRASERAHPRSKDTKTVDWSYRWFVRGHWRNQPYKRAGVVRPRFVLPYMKGPEGKPIKTPDAKVYAVTK